MYAKLADFVRSTPETPTVVGLDSNYWTVGLDLPAEARPEFFHQDQFHIPDASHRLVDAWRQVALTRADLADPARWWTYDRGQSDGSGRVRMDKIFVSPGIDIVDADIEHAAEGPGCLTTPLFGPISPCRGPAHMTAATSELDRAAGVLVGLAAGDALGAGYEFQSSPPPDPQMIGGGAFGWEPGEWTDDTQMALCIAEVAAGGALDVAQVGQRFLDWYRAGPTDVGNQTRAVLGAAREPGDLAALAAQHFANHPARGGGQRQSHAHGTRCPRPSRRRQGARRSGPSDL